MTNAVPGLTLFSPSGLILNPKMPAGQDPFLVTKAVPFLGGQTLGAGDMVFDSLGPKGQVLVNLTLGTALGSASALIVLLDDTGTARVTISLDTSNRPLFTLLSASGATVASWAPSGAALAAGKPLSVKLEWNSLTGVVVFSDAFGVPLAGAFGTAPSGSWTMSPLFRASVGYDPSGTPVATSATIQKAQVSSVTSV